MVDKLNQVKAVMQTGIENIAVFSYINKISIYDLEKKACIAELKARNNGWISHIEFENYVGVDAQVPYVVDLNKLEIVKTLNEYKIIEKYLLDPKYKSEFYHVESTVFKIVDMIPGKLICYVNYIVSDNGRTSMYEKYAALCMFSLITWEFLGSENLPYSMRYRHNRRMQNYSFLEYDTDAANAVLAPLKIKKKPNFRVLLYNKKFNVIYFLNGDFCYSYYLDADNTKTNDKISEEDNIFSQSNFDAEDYIRQNGLTPDVLNHLSDEEILGGGYFWALDCIDRKAEELKLSSENILNTNHITDEEKILYAIGLFETYLKADGIDQYFASGDSKEFKCLINVLKLIGADATAKIIADGEKIIKSFDKSTQFEKFSRLEEELNEDYIGMAIRFIKKQRGFN